MALNLKDPKYYFNRECSWLLFNDRVLEEAEDESHPLLERLKFLSIFSSNLDEFYMIRVAGLKDQVHAGIHEMPADGMSPQEQLERISEHVHRAMKRQSKVLSDAILPQMRKRGIRLRHYSALTAEQKVYLRRYFKDRVFPVLTPLAVDPAHPFPQLRNLVLNVLVELRPSTKRAESRIAVIPIPPLLNRFIPIPGKRQYDFIPLEDLVLQNLDLLFPNMRVMSTSLFRVTRNADFDISEAEADDLLKLIERELRKRRLGTVIRMEVSENMSEDNRRFLRRNMGLSEDDIFDIEGYLDLTSFMDLATLNRPELRDAKFTPTLREKIASADNVFQAIRKSDVMMHHPYDSFNPVIDLVQEAARDPQVMAIKQTLYRTTGKSPIVQALKDAANNGKQVTALIELKARFDEETNIVWAKELERAGVNVIYGVLGLKTHCKLLMIVRNEEGELRRYVHLSTGNYNEKTARIYTDLGLMTVDPSFGKDASELFNYLTGISGQKNWRKFLVAPINMRSSLVKQIQQCIDAHKPSQPSRIRMVMNSLVDPEMIQWLYKASMKGIQVDLVVRGICCLRPGIKGISDHITVRSIVGRFLEHCRIYQFDWEDSRQIYMGSADLMQRNLNRRMEILYPLEDLSLQARVMSIVDTMLADNVKARELTSEGEYLPVSPGADEEALNAQHMFLQMAMERHRHIDTIH